MTRPFEGIRIIDITHVLAGPFAAYQLAVLGADVIKVEHPDDPDQTRGSGTDRALNRRQMGTSYLTRGIQQTFDHARSEKRGRARHPEAPGSRSRCDGRKLPTGCVCRSRSRL